MQMIFVILFVVSCAPRLDAWRTRDLWEYSKVASVAKTDVNTTRTQPSIPILRQGQALKVCECEYTVISSHGGLQCEKEGWFIYSFEATGHWVRPASRALFILTAFQRLKRE
jgi:hypothetical protein